MESPVRYAPSIRLSRSVILKQASMFMKNSGMNRKEAMKHAWAVGKGGPGYMWMPWTISLDPAIIVSPDQFTITRKIQNRYGKVETIQRS